MTHENLYDVLNIRTGATVLSGISLAAALSAADTYNAANPNSFLIVPPGFKGLSLEEIKAAVLAGKTVHWKSPAYEVVYAENEFFIVYDKGSPRENYIGLTHTDGVTLNGRPYEFYLGSR